MAARRAPIFPVSDNAPGGALDVSDFRPAPAGKGARRDQVKAVAEPASFRSRDPATPAPPPRREQRRHRTGRNVQLNLKVRQEDADAFYALADEHGWVLGEAFQKAVEALRRSR